jgi:single-strand DNA-binding protein
VNDASKQMEIKGTIYKVGATQQVTDKFKKREVILITEQQSQYPQHIKVQFSQDKCDLADSLQPNQEVTFQCNLRGKLYTDKNGNENTITNLEVWKVEGGVVQPNSAGLPQTDLDDTNLPF